MELREFAERVLFSQALSEKLAPALTVTDEQPGPAILAPQSPGRPGHLRFKPQNTGKSSNFRIQALERPHERGRLLHFFANHELLATELMALVLLRFPEAPPAFRRGILRTLREEQEHTRWYLQRMSECGIAFGELPVSGYFWRAVSSMGSPLDYVVGLSLTFEQANLDFARFFSGCFSKVGDVESARLLDRVYQDEIGHVAYGLKWFRRWKVPHLSDWEAFRTQLKYPLSAQRAKGSVFNVEGRLAAGFDRQFIDELNVYAHSKGRAPGVFVFNPFAEGWIGYGRSFTPNKHQQLLQQDLENLPQFLCRPDDIVLIQSRPSAAFLTSVKEAGYVVPEFVELERGCIGPASTLRMRKISKLNPWAWGPDSKELLLPLIPQITVGRREPDDYYNEPIGRLYSKEWSLALLRKILTEPLNSGLTCQAMRKTPLSKAGLHSWLCSDTEVGAVVCSVSEALDQINAIRKRGHHKVIVKQALGIAGHNAIRLFEPELLQTQQHWIKRSLEHGRKLIIEPWLERVLDFSLQLEMTSTSLKRIGYTGLLNNWKGQFQGNWAGPGFHRRLGPALGSCFPQILDIEQFVSSLYDDICLLLERELKSLAYEGPVGIDAFVYRTPEGAGRLKPIVEINPRYTMGRLTLELMKNVAPGLTGTFQLIGRNTLKQNGYSDFSAWAHLARQRYPIRRQGEPAPKLSHGLVCLNDPAHARVCLAIFRVASSATFDLSWV